MSSNSGQVPNSSKVVNIPSQSVSAVFYSTPSVDSGSQRRTGGSGSFGAGLAARNSSSPRNNQALKSHHKRQRRPRLLDDDEYSETAVMRSTTSRKGQTSITHLMNFSLPPRPQYQPPPRNSRRYASWGLGSGYHAMDKARYVHANYRFIVNPTRSYHAQAANADVHLDWDSVLQVLVSAQTQSTSCPICLSTPVAPRMARCGHIFCLPCLIRYMHSTDDDTPVPEKKARWKKCPICWDSIYISETRPVRWFRGQEGDIPVEGGDVVLRLVKRDPGSTLALPRDGAESLNPGEDVPWYHAAEVADYARIMKGGEDYMIAQYDAEVEDLRRQEAEDELLFGDDTTWTKKAIATINDAKAKIKGIGNPPDVERQPAMDKSLREAVPAESPPDATQTGTPSAESMSSSGVGTGATTTPATTGDVDRVAEAVSKVQLNSTPEAKLKQKDPGPLPQFYLSPLDIRILKAAFGDYATFPATILPRVERISSGHIVDDELRKRVKYLSHLPQGCEVNFLECDWRDVVVPEILERFSAETGRRRKRNKEKEAREEKERLRAEKEEEEKRWAAARRRRPSIGISDPPFSGQDFQPLSNDPTADGFPPFDAGSSSASPPRLSSQFGALASPSTTPPGVRTVWGTTVAPSISESSEVPSRPARHDGWREDWEEELLAHQERQLLAQTSLEGNQPSSAGGGGRKKKNKKITLMSTNIQRGA
ncbi:RING-type E3 ubiquitin transferase MAG2 [Aspergillus novofumigatus IBT 16806]|uniref:RING finger domain protein n=1 Tax=Aspergillus novofumigatus (strain IBT 16806) TaxID=1392255 RepID=A0A2I1CAB4_ASPN1|nr:RING finger domain protein [Aspergillus novofumigatus IBT 16806]PKX94565.1 RING finger domain protein [Aspergillus novofumigatus IBT 16806]